ncbi:hypothetical protein ENSA5_39440 [Enhygromyxa salina]|uniref:Uncharacterized protein n=1 Tax=Enhygromyxa salina TaxID=215803 RepID=A0A2S9XR69_9BACT|nr:MYXO-CTERM sorting domain-containing protein [Enhygromyxa salina]PRP95359.1 hypothetical protein ENSA5_39440 [Enhygromyxa salina]
MTAAFALTSGDALATGDGENGGDLSSAWFVVPLPNAAYEGAPVTIDAEIGVHQGLDGVSISSIELFVDDESIGAQDCPDGCTFPGIELAKGVHDLELVADSGYATGVKVYVDEPAPGGTSATGDDGDSEGGGKCSVQDGPAPGWGVLALPLLLLVPGFRSRR